MKHPLPSRALILLGVSLLLTSAVAMAQDAPNVEATKVEATGQVEAPPATATLPERKFTVENVPIELLVWWLDPSGRPLPHYIQSSLDSGGELPRRGLFVSPNLSMLPFANSGSAPPQGQPNPQEPTHKSSAPRKPGRLGNALGPVGAELPAEVSIVSVEKERNRMTARGPVTGLDALGELIRQIDVPLQQAEVRMTLVEVARDDLNTLGLKFANKSGSPATEQTRTAITLAPDNGRALDELIEKKSAQLLGTPRFIVLNGLTGKASVTEINSTILDYKYQGAPAGSAPGFFFVETSNALTCGAEVNGDMVALRINIEWDNAVASVAGTLRDGQTLAIRLPASDPKSPTVRIAFLTPHIIKRAG